LRLRFFTAKYKTSNTTAHATQQVYPKRLNAPKEFILPLWIADITFHDYKSRIYNEFSRRRQMRKEKVFSLIGELTIQFATLEHRLQGLLKILMRKDNVLIGPLFIHELRLATLLRKIRIVALCRIPENKPLLKNLERVIKRINTTRAERNLLMHGDWQIENMQSFPIKVRDFKIRYENGRWQEFTETKLTEKKLTQLLRRLKGLVQEVEYLVRVLNDMQIVPDAINQPA
jgi:hypothetical protein